MLGAPVYPAFPYTIYLIAFYSFAVYLLVSLLSAPCLLIYRSLARFAISLVVITVAMPLLLGYITDRVRYIREETFLRICTKYRTRG